MSEKLRSATVTLDYPVQHEGRDIQSLTFRRMKAKDALLAEGEENKARAGYLLFAALAGVDLAVIEELDIEDLEKIGEAVVPLMGKSAEALIDKAKQAQ
ncbi:phage tail assembly protein [Aquamicrobium zhengzhouense]|uniref:Phage tail assembly protein n=1 Tax=Aquamicrobium zhengzhouense TaxID=2781738 RepID=A0ABS0SA90_9HYPH|nr:phage tail assembly protein [Aquamicrobium zhengzhouense]MBI1620167.1 phage tail assembly protein [Aquamicrobium zhengzhouense]